MTKVKTHINRRSFIKVSAVAGGGVMIGVSTMASCTEPSKAAIIIPELEQPSTWHEVGHYIKIGDNDVITILSPNPEIGQNVKTSMPMIVAEELEADWDKVQVEQAHLNTEWYTRQVAGGSQSIRAEWDALRTAGAATKTMLVAAAAEQWGVTPDQCTVAKGVITSPSGETVTYGSIAHKIVDMEVPEDVELKDAKDYTIIGSSKRNVDIKDIVTGKPLFGIDTQVDGMKYACVLRPPAFGQKLDSYDDSAAKQVNGVEQVFEFGDKIAVVANSTWAAIKGKRALTANWKSDKKLESTADHDRIMMELLDTAPEKPARQDGDIKKAFAEADEVVERVYESPFLPHNCLEPMNFFAHVTDEKIHCRGPIQTPSWTENRIAELTGRPNEEIHIEMTRMGGGFGRRLYGDFALEAVEVSEKAGVPVQLQFTREDDMTAGTYRVAIKYKIRAALKDGKVTGYHLTEAASNSNMYGLIPNFFPAGAIPNLQYDLNKFDSDVTTGAWRAPYTNFLAFAEQSFFDEVAEKLEKDPVDLRLELLEDAKANVDDERMQYSPERMQECIRMVAEKSDWKTEKPGISKGISAYYSHNTHVAEVAEVAMEDGLPVVKKVHCVVDCGILINPKAATNQAEGGVIDGVGHAMYGDISFDNGKPSVSNFDAYRLIRQSEAPVVDVYFVDNGKSPTGLGEPTLPPAGGAVANAIFKATGKRLYKQPFMKQEALIG